MNPFDSEMWETPNPKSQTSGIFPAAFARKALGAPAEAGVWPAGAEGRVADGRRSSHRCQPRPRDARHGEAGGQTALPSGASETAEVETWLRPSARRPKGQHWHKEGSVLEVVHSQLLPAWEGMGRRDVLLSRALPASVCRYLLQAAAVLWGLELTLGVSRPMVEHVSCSP